MQDHHGCISSSEFAAQVLKYCGEKSKSLGHKLNSGSCPVNVSATTYSFGDWQKPAITLRYLKMMLID